VARYDGANEELAVDYHLSGPRFGPATPPDLYVMGPASSDILWISSRVTGAYRGGLRIGSLEGLFRFVRSRERSFPEVGLYRRIRAIGLRIERSAVKVDSAIDRRQIQSLDAAVIRLRRQDTSTRACGSGPVCSACGSAESIELAMRKWRGIIESIRGSRLRESRTPA